jgi:hypothetical protein
MIRQALPDGPFVPTNQAMEETMMRFTLLLFVALS